MREGRRGLGGAGEAPGSAADSFSLRGGSWDCVQLLVPQLFLSLLTTSAK